jgi:hypothetical protein
MQLHAAVRHVELLGVPKYDLDTPTSSRTYDEKGGTAGRDLQRLEMWGHKDVHWSQTPPYSLRVSPATPSQCHSFPPPVRASSTRPTPPSGRSQHGSKPRAPGTEVAARALGRDRRGRRHSDSVSHNTQTHYD